MGLYVFYSWQSDISSKLNRNFIEDALKKAIKKIGKDLQVQNALRDENLLLDKDTKDSPGIPPIADTILKKISGCAIFVPDLTFVGKTEGGRFLPNPNVLVEYGWALKEVGHARIVPVMNKAFGEPSGQNLPFDMRHLRHPLTYSLKDDSGQDEKSKAKSALIKELINAINLIIKNGLLDALIQSSERFPETPYTNKPSTFLQHGETISYSGHFDNGVDQLNLLDVQHLFLRIIPTSEVPPIRNTNAALELVRSGNLMPMSEGNIGCSTGRNRYGAYSCSFKDQKILNFSQLFKNGELWGIDSDSIDKGKCMKWAKVNFGYFPCVDFEQTFYRTLINYLDFSKTTLKLPLPLKLIAGATDVEGYRMPPPPGMHFGGYERFRGNVVEQHIIYDGLVDSYDIDASKILLPFFEYVWEECGLNRPNKGIFGL